MHISPKPYCFVLLLLFLHNCLAEENVYFLREHLAEAAQDSRYFAQPWPDSDAAGWYPVVAAGAAASASDLEEMQGQMFSIGAMYGGEGKWQYLAMVFYDRFDVSGGSGTKTLTSGNLRNVPLDLPATAEFSSADGRINHYGASFSAKRIFSENPDSGRKWSWVAGLYYEYLELENYRINYRLLSGTDAGSTGIIDNSGSNAFVSPYVGLLLEQQLNNNYVLGTRVSVGQPLPEGNFTTRIIGSGFDVSSNDPNNVKGVIGDPYIMLGMDLRNRKTGLRIDFGSLLTFPLIEKLSHPGVNSGWMISLAWEIK